MRRAARLAVRFLAFSLLKIGRRVERIGRGLAVASFTRDETFDLSVAEWEAFGDDNPLEQWFAWEADILARHVRPGDSILVVGAGSGRDVLPFLAAGYDVTALDITPRALDTLKERARTRGFTLTTVHASIVDAELAPRAFDVALFSWFSFSYLQGRAGRRAALSRSEAALRPGGRIILSYPVRVGGRAVAPPASLIVRAAARLLGGLLAETGDEAIVSGTAARPAVFFTHPFAPSEIEDEVKETGFSIVFHERPNPDVGVMVLQRRSEAA